MRLAGLFLDKGGIVATKDSSEKVTILANGAAASGTKGDKRKVIIFPAEDPRAVYTGPLVVLTSRLSASASEIVAGALKDYHRAVIVGSDHTFGKGSVQALMPLPWDLGGITVTTALYFLPGGKSTQKIGVEADVQSADLVHSSKILVKRGWITRFRPRRSCPSSASRETPRRSGKLWSSPYSRNWQQDPRPGSPKTRSSPRSSRTTRKPPARRV
ncbi:MAG: S41 family peptidase [Desulfobacterales bacterium]|nr:S41 family peptidase [Desulfobacterales bacterium]